jgi:hypothetical protein
MFSFIARFKHSQEMRESKDEILIGEIVLAMTQLGYTAIRFLADGGYQHVQFKPVQDPVINTLTIILDKKTGDGLIGQALLGSQAVLTFQLEVKNYLADPDDLVNMFRTDLQNIFKMPLLGDIRLNHQLNSVFATKKAIINIDDYLIAMGKPANLLRELISQNIQQLREKAQAYKKA